MIVPLLCALLGGAIASPRWRHGPPPVFDRPNPMGMQLSPYMNEDMFDTNRFWSDFSRDMEQMNTELSMNLGRMHEGIARDLDLMHENLAKEMSQLDTMLSDLSKTLPKTITDSKFEGNQYKITMTLQGFEEKDIVVKARNGVLMIQAVHQYSGNSQSSFLTIRNLPAQVQPNGTWTLENGVLEIVFPLKQEVVVSSTEAPIITQTENNVGQSREELETQHSENTQDADVGLRGDNDADIRTNEIPRLPVEATTYAVDLKDEVEFVPIKNTQ